MKLKNSKNVIYRQKPKGERSMKKLWKKIKKIRPWWIFCDGIYGLCREYPLCMDRPSAEDAGWDQNVQEKLKMEKMISVCDRVCTSMTHTNYEGNFRGFELFVPE